MRRPCLPLHPEGLFQLLRRYAALSLPLALSWTFCGCGPLFPARPKTFATQEEAGSTHVAVLSVGRWQDYVDDLQPTFKFDEKAAFDGAGAATRDEEDKFETMISATLKLSRDTSKTGKGGQGGSGKGGDSGSGGGTGSGSGGSGDGSGTGSAGGGSSSGSDGSSGSSAGGSSGGASGGGSKAGGGSGSGGSGSGAGAGDKSGKGAGAGGSDGQGAKTGAAAAAALPQDAMTQFALATALYQEVKLLNRYVRDASMIEHADPYVVRMQITLMPAAHLEPYDAYTTVSFFLEPPCDDPCTPRIVPLMVTDDLESTAHAASIQRVQQLALSAMLMGKVAGANFDFNDTQKKLRNILGRDYNSLLTVSRLSDNTYRVRFGAQQAAATDYEMVPRTHNVTFLMLVPRKRRLPNSTDDDQRARAVRLMARTAMVDTRTGVPLDSKQGGIAFERMKETLRTFPGGYFRRLADDGEIVNLIDILVRNDFKEFSDNVGTTTPPVLREALWVNLVSDMTHSRYAATIFELPRRSPSPFLAQTALIEDSPTGATVTLSGGTWISRDSYFARLHLQLAPAAPACPGTSSARQEPPCPAPDQPTVPPVRLELAANRVEVNSGATAATFHFPHISAFGKLQCGALVLDPMDGASRSGEAELQCDAQAGACAGLTPSLGQRSTCFEVRQQLPTEATPAEKPDFTATVPSHSIVADNRRHGVVQLLVDNQSETPVHFAVSSAVLAVSSQDAIEYDAAHRTLLGGSLLLTLGNLVPGSLVKVTAWKEKPGKPGDLPERQFVQTVPVQVRDGGGTRRGGR
jgi:hypothetical protein